MLAVFRAAQTSVSRFAPRRSFSALPSGPLSGLRVLDLSRILAGPSATQMLADMGAEVIKVERPGGGDDTRRYAPPFLPKSEAEDSDVAAYFSSCNRNKYSVAIDFTKKDGQDVVRHLLEESDVVIENFKAGSLKKYGLGYDQLKEDFPGLVYCSITGFGHTGPYSKRPAYDMLIQAMGGSMSLTGVPDGEPMKTGLSLFDLTAGLHGVIGILAAIHNKKLTGLGQHVDISMLDVSVSLLANQGMNFLAKKERQARVGNNHPNVVPYQVMPASDGHFILTASNNDQFERFCKVAGMPELMQDDRFNSMKARVVNRSHVTPALNEITSKHPKAWWLENLEKEGVGCAPILHLDEVFEDPHVQSRDMEIQMNLPGFEKPVSLIGSPMKFSRTKVDYRMPPPRVGEHTQQVLTEAGYSMSDVAELATAGAIDTPEFAQKSPEQPTLRKTRKFMQASYAVKGNTWGDLASVSVPLTGSKLEKDENEDTLELVLRGSSKDSPLDTLRALSNESDVDSPKSPKSAKPEQPVAATPSSEPTTSRAE